MGNVISVRVNEDERNILNKAAMIYGGGVSSMIKKLVFEKLEDDFDLKIMQEYEQKRANGLLELYTPDEVWKEIGV